MELEQQQNTTIAPAPAPAPAPEKQKRKIKIVKTFTILTEEFPSWLEIIFILSHILYIPKQLFEHHQELLPPPTCKIGEWQIIFDRYKIIIKLFKGKTSCVDYIVFRGKVDNNTPAGNAICILESTKTTDTSSRNTSVCQRLTKFMVFLKFYPDSKARRIMFYNCPWKNKDTTNTARFGLMLMKSLGIEAYHCVENEYDDLFNSHSIPKFTSIPQMITEKNSIKERKGNVHVKITKQDDNTFIISAKLDKGTSKNCGKILHDPNVGLVTGIINFLNIIQPSCRIMIHNHNIKQEYFDKKPNSKFWHAIKGYDVEFSGITIINKPELPYKYFTIENSCTEKQATILFEQKINKEYSTIFSNHSGCALTNIKTPDKDIIVERTMPRPDILFYNSEKDRLLIVEGKIEKDIHLGINQLRDSNLQRFIQLIRPSYPDSTIQKGLCITIDDISNINKYSGIEFPILFALDKNGSCYYNV